MSNLEYYREEFKKQYADLSAKFECYGNLDSNELTLATSEIDAQLSELKSCLRSFHMELQHVSSGIMRKQLLNESNDFSKSLEDLQRRWLVTIKTVPATSSSVSSSVRRRAELAVEKMERSQSQLENSRQLLAETEQIGESVLEDLYGQRETIMRAKQNAQNIRSNLDEADSSISRMSKWWHSFIS